MFSSFSPNPPPQNPKVLPKVLEGDFVAWLDAQYGVPKEHCRAIKANAALGAGQAVILSQEIRDKFDSYVDGWEGENTKFPGVKLPDVVREQLNPPPVRNLGMGNAVNVRDLMQPLTVKTLDVVSADFLAWARDGNHINASDYAQLAANVGGNENKKSALSSDLTAKLTDARNVYLKTLLPPDQVRLIQAVDLLMSSEKSQSTSPTLEKKGGELVEDFLSWGLAENRFTSTEHAQLTKNQRSPEQSVPLEGGLATKLSDAHTQYLRENSDKLTTREQGRLSVEITGLQPAQSLAKLKEKSEKDGAELAEDFLIWGLTEKRFTSTEHAQLTKNQRSPEQSTPLEEALATKLSEAKTQYLVENSDKLTLREKGRLSVEITEMQSKQSFTKSPEKSGAELAEDFLSWGLTEGRFNSGDHGQLTENRVLPVQSKMPLEEGLATKLSDAHTQYLTENSDKLTPREKGRLSLQVREMQPKQTLTESKESGKKISEYARDVMGWAAGNFAFPDGHAEALEKNIEALEKKTAPMPVLREIHDTFNKALLAYGDEVKDPQFAAKKSTILAMIASPQEVSKTMELGLREHANAFLGKLDLDLSVRDDTIKILRGNLNASNRSDMVPLDPLDHEAVAEALKQYAESSGLNTKNESNKKTILDAMSLDTRTVPKISENPQIEVKHWGWEDSSFAQLRAGDTFRATSLQMHGEKNINFQNSGRKLTVPMEDIVKAYRGQNQNPDFSKQFLFTVEKIGPNGTVYDISQDNICLPFGIQAKRSENAGKSYNAISDKLALSNSSSALPSAIPTPFSRSASASTTSVSSSSSTMENLELCGDGPGTFFNPINSTSFNGVNKPLYRDLHVENFTKHLVENYRLELSPSGDAHYMDKARRNLLISQNKENGNVNIHAKESMESYDKCIKDGLMLAYASHPTAHTEGLVLKGPESFRNKATIIAARNGMKINFQQSRISELTQAKYTEEHATIPAHPNRLVRSQSRGAIAH